jgi:hypothetical protein
MGRDVLNQCLIEFDGLAGELKLSSHFNSILAALVYLRNDEPIISTG